MLGFVVPVVILAFSGQRLRAVRRGKLLPGLALLLLLPYALSLSSASSSLAKAAGDGANDSSEANERCAIRLAIALQGKSPDPSQLASANPQSLVDAMLASDEFADRYSRFINSEFNGEVGTPTDDVVYYLARHVITKSKPWSDLFIGPYAINPSATAMDVTDDPAGLGYFRSPSWMKRYAGNEPQGYLLSASFRILSNTTNLMLTASVGAPDDDRTATGRAAPACKGCHLDAWFALDKFAMLLPKKKVVGDVLSFTPAAGGPQQLLGKTIKDDKELVTALVESDAWRFAQCRNVFKFLYGRDENQCEAPVFDACVDALVRTGTIQSAVAAVAKDPSFCTN